LEDLQRHPYMLLDFIDKNQSSMTNPITGQ
jgi:hypothetical protein